MGDGYRTQSMDTDPEVERRQFEIWRGMTPGARLQLADALARLAHGLARAGVRLRNPQATERDVFLHMASFRLDRATMIRLYGWDPDARPR